MAITAPLLWLDGTLVDSAAATIPMMAHAPQRGSLVFDVGSFHPVKLGVAMFRAREHVARFLRSARIVGLALAYDEEALLRAANDVVVAADRDEGLIRWSVYFASNEPDLLPRDASTHVAVAAQLLQDPPRAKPIRVATFDDARKAAPEALSPEAKVAAAYLGPMLARKRAVAAGADDGPGSPTITSVALAGPDSVTVTLSAPPTGGNRRIRYAYTGVLGAHAGLQTGAHGNLRDSDATPSQNGFTLYDWCVHFDEAVP
jgi:hypothetical protein